MSKYKYFNKLISSHSRARFQVQKFIHGPYNVFVRIDCKLGSANIRAYGIDSNLSWDDLVCNPYSDIESTVRSLIDKHNAEV